MPTIAEALRQGVELHHRGRLIEAEQVYRQVLESDSRNADAWHLLGLIAHAHGKHDAAIDAIGRAIKLDGRQPSFHANLAEVSRLAGRMSEAEASCRQALALADDFAVAHNTLGVVLNQQGRFEEAAECFRRALAIDANFTLPRANLAAALHALGRLDEAAAECRNVVAADPSMATVYRELGLIQHKQGHTGQAIETLREALRVNPRLVEAECNLGALLQLQSRLDEAIGCYRRALGLEPNLAWIHCNLGSALRDLGQTTEAAQSYRRAVECDPSLAEAHYNLGVLLQGRGNAAAAIECYRAAIATRTDYAQAHHNLGTLYMAQGELQQAGECFSQALALKPDSAEAVNNLGNLARYEGRPDEARESYLRALQIDENYALAHFNLAQSMLTEGDFTAGWREYEWRLKCPEFAKFAIREPRWEGDELAGRALLVQAEQGLGDTIQFARYLRPLAQTGATLIFQIQPPLLKLFQQSPLAQLAQLVTTDDELPKFDVCVPLLSVPGILGTTAENVPPADDCLAADPRLVDHWRGALGDTASLRVGIAWQGRPTYGDCFRSIPLTEFEPLAISGVQLVSLQKGFGVEQLAALGGQFPVRDLGPEFDEASGAFMDTTAVIKNIDLIVTSDTVTAHLAATLGAEVWVALPLAADWRWMRARSDSPWYASMRLFRQSRPRVWDDVFAQMAGELQSLVARRGHG